MVFLRTDLLLCISDSVTLPRADSVAQALGSDPIFGACLVYDLVGLHFGQEGIWRRDLGWYAGAASVAVGLKALYSVRNSGNLRLN